MLMKRIFAGDWGRRSGFTALEVLISVAILAIFAAAVYVVYLTSQRLMYAGLAQSLAVADARTSLEKIERVIREGALIADLAAPIADGGKRLNFFFDPDHDPYVENDPVRRSLVYGAGADGNFATSEDNTITYDPNTAIGNDQVFLNKHVTQVVTGGGVTLPVFALTADGRGVQINYRVVYRYAIEPTQPVDISVEIRPRN